MKQSRTGFSPYHRLNVLFCEGNIDDTIGGSYFSLLFLVAGLDKSRFSPTVVFHKDNNLIPQFEETGATVCVAPAPIPFQFPVPRANGHRLYRFAYPALLLVQRTANFFKFFVHDAPRRARLLRKLDVDILHLNNSVIRNHDWMLGALLSRKTVITHERGINEHYSRMAKFFAKRLSAIICISNAVRRSLAKGGIEGQNVVTIYNGIDPQVMTAQHSSDSIRMKYGIQKACSVVGVIGNIKEWKGQETIIRAWPSIQKQYPSAVCMLIGDVSPADLNYKSHLDRLISDLQIRDKIIFTGYTDDVGSHLAALDIAVHTSVAPEPFGRVLIEAMALRKPLVGAAEGAVPEIIEDKRTGLLFQPGNAKELAHCILELLDNPETAAQMADRGFARLTQNFHVDTNIRKTETLYASIANLDGKHFVDE